MRQGPRRLTPRRRHSAALARRRPAPLRSGEGSATAVFVPLRVSPISLRLWEGMLLPLDEGAVHTAHKHWRRFAMSHTMALASLAALSVALLSVPALGQAPKPSAAAFFVATDGNDRWSGALSEPNEDRTDGPFATIS